MAENKRPIIVQEGAPEWVLTYGDMMSLLLTFFIMLFALSTLEIVKFQAAAESLQQQFGYSRVSSNPMPGTMVGNSSKSQVRAIGRAKRRDMLKGGAPVPAPVGEFNRVQTINPLGKPVVGGIVRFTPGSSQLDTTAKEGLNLMAGQLTGTPNKIEIRGHTGVNEPLGPSGRNTYDLGYSRAYAVMDALTKLGVPRRNIRISSVAEYDPPSASVLLPGEDSRKSGAYVEILKTEEPLVPDDDSLEPADRRFIGTP